MNWPPLRYLSLVPVNLKGLNSVGKSSLNDFVALGVGRVAPGIQAWWDSEMAGLSGVVLASGPSSLTVDVLSNGVSSVTALFWNLVDIFLLAGFVTFAGFLTFVAKDSLTVLSPKVNLPTKNGGCFFESSLSLAFWTSRFSLHLRSSSSLAFVSLVAIICMYIYIYIYIYGCVAV